jgi:hypothetical protein
MDNPIKTILALAFMCGIPTAVSSVVLFNESHSIWLAVIGTISAFLGVTLSYGMKGFREHPKHIGNLDGSIRPVINQNWIMFLITLIINLMIANLAGSW